jgi:hypothetical protein
MAEDDDDKMRIEGSPTKDFFIFMLTKDIALGRAILDLVDNSIDGARRLRKTRTFKGLTIRIEATPDRFRIADNCGGIPTDIARQYAFRFGRPTGMPKTKHSVGQFGVGMKRALFKLGEHFRIESRTDATYFVVDVEVEHWKNNTKDWDFRFNELVEDKANLPEGEPGTDVTVTKLHDVVADEFRLENFLNRLRRELEAAHQGSMAKGAELLLNDRPLVFKPAELFQSKVLKPAYKELQFREDTPTPVTVRLYAGIAESDPNSAGWYLFCNERLVLEHDQQLLTGWGEGNGKTIPKYHNQFAMFRGYAFFDCDDAEYLPWNTTKTGVDEDSPAFGAVRREMITLMRPVLDFLNRLDAERDGGPARTPLADAVSAAKPSGLTTITKPSVFVAPAFRPVSAPAGPKMGRIKYYKPVEEIDQVKRALKVGTFELVGERTFEYYRKLECED